MLARFRMPLAPAGPVFFHPFGNFQPLVGAHGLPAAPARAFWRWRQATRGALQFLERGNDALQFLLLGVQVLYGFIKIHRISVDREDRPKLRSTDVTSIAGTVPRKKHYRIRNGQCGTNLNPNLVVARYRQPARRSSTTITMVIALPQGKRRFSRCSTSR